MNCEGWRIEIAAFLDGSSDPSTISGIRRHLDTCSSCLEFYREQSELNAVLGSPDLQVEPPEYLWYRIESRMAKPVKVSTFQTVLDRLFGFWQVPRLRYALVSSLLLLMVCSWSLVQIKHRRNADQVLLARIDAYQMNVGQGNPFLPDIKKAPADNPFLSFGNATSNPFESKGSRQ